MQQRFYHPSQHFHSNIFTCLMQTIERDPLSNEVPWFYFYSSILDFGTFVSQTKALTFIYLFNHLFGFLQSSYPCDSSRSFMIWSYTIYGNKINDRLKHAIESSLPAISKKKKNHHYPLSNIILLHHPNNIYVHTVAVPG